MEKSHRLNKITPIVLKKALAAFVAGVFLFNSAFSWAQEEKLFSAGTENMPFSSDPAKNSKLAVKLRTTTRDFKERYKVAAICRFIEEKSDLEYIESVEKWKEILEADFEDIIVIRKSTPQGELSEIIIEIPKEELAIRYFNPEKVNVITPYSDISKLQTKVIGPRLNRQIIHTVKALSNTSSYLYEYVGQPDHENTVMPSIKDELITSNAENADREKRKTYEEEVKKISPYLLKLVDGLFQNHKYSSYGITYSLDASTVNIAPIDSIKEIEKRCGNRNIFLPIFSDSDKKTLVQRIKNIQNEVTVKYIHDSVREYVKQRYGVECEVIGTYINGSSLYGWSKEVKPGDIDNVTLIRLPKNSPAIRDHMYEFPEHLKRQGINISGTAIQSVDDLNSDHPHTKTALGSAYTHGIPIFEKERLIGKMDRKNMLFFAFTAIEAKRSAFLYKNKKKYAKYINRLIDAKAMLFKLGLIERFDHHREWERFDAITKSILSNDDKALEFFINGILKEYIALKVIIEKALQVERTKVLEEIVATYRACDEAARKAFASDYIKRLEKANGIEYGFPPEEHNFRAWSERRKLAFDKEALEREHLALLELNDLAIKLSLAKNTSFESVRQALRDQGIEVNKNFSPNQDKKINNLFLKLSQERDIKIAYRILGQIAQHKEKSLSALTNLLFEDREEYKSLVLYRLGEIGSPRAVPFIIEFCSSLLKKPLNSGSREELLIDLCIETLGKCISDKSLAFLLGILEQTDSNYRNITTSNQLRAKQALLSLCKNPAILFPIVWEIKKKIHESEISNIDKMSGLIDLLDEMPIDLKLKKDLMREFLGKQFKTPWTSAILTIKEMGSETNSINGIAIEYSDVLKQILSELSTVISRRGPPANFAITTDLKKLDQDHNDGLPFVATSYPGTNTIFLHPYFFSLSKEKQSEILTRELVCYLYRNIRDGKSILLEAKAVLALAKWIAKVKSVSSDADIVVGVPFHKEFDTIENVCNTVIKGLKKYYPDKKCVVVCLGNPDIVINEEISRRIEKINSENENIHIVTFISSIQGKGMALRFIMESALALSAKACAFIDADEKRITPEWPHLLLSPVLSGKYDFVSARYARHHHTATITNHFAYPLISAMYGKSVRQPLGGEFACSADLMGQYLEDPDVWVTDVGTYGIDNWLTSTAIVDAAAMCEVDLGVKMHNFSYFVKREIMFKQVAKALFSQIKQNIYYWRKLDSIQPNEIFGSMLNSNTNTVSRDYREWVKAARRNFINNRKVYKEFLSPEIDKYLEKLFSTSDEEFYFPVEKWADCIYEFINVYLFKKVGTEEAFWNALLALSEARVGSFIKETSNISHKEAEQIINDQLEIFINKKRNLIKQWEMNRRKIGAHPKVEVVNPLPHANVKGFVFDWDGTIIYTIPQWRDIIKKVLVDILEKDILITDKLPYHLGAAGVIHWAVREAKRREAVTAKSEQEYQTNYVEAMNNFVLGLKDSDVFIPGVKDFLTLLANSDFNMFVLTAAYQQEKVFQTQKLGIDRLFEEIIGKEDAFTLRFKTEQLKRNIMFKTEQLRRIKEKHGFSNQEIAMFGDTPFDIKAAKNAGVIAIGIAEDEETREILIGAGADIIINGDYINIDLLPILNKETVRTSSVESIMVKTQTDYIEKNKISFKNILGENKPDTLVRVPVEAIESVGKNNIKDFLATFQEAPNGYVELYYMSGIGEVNERIYQKYGLQKKSLPKNFKRTRENTVTLFPALKGEEINQSTIVSRLGSLDISPQDTILSPIGLQYDLVGLIRATILGLKMMDIARQIKEKGVDIIKDQAFKDEIQLEILEQLKNACDTNDLKNFDLTPDDIIALATGTINGIVAALKKLIKLLPITPIDAEELRQIYEHAKQVLIAA